MIQLDCRVALKGEVLYALRRWGHDLVVAGDWRCRFN
jgi:hypothetical protein